MRSVQMGSRRLTPIRCQSPTPGRCQECLSRRRALTAAASLAVCVARLPGLLTAQAATGVDPALLRAFKDAMAAQGDPDVRTLCSTCLTKRVNAAIACLHVDMLCVSSPTHLLVSTDCNCALHALKHGLRTQLAWHEAACGLWSYLFPVQGRSMRAWSRPPSAHGLMPSALRPAMRRHTATGVQCGSRQDGA